MRTEKLEGGPETSASGGRFGYRRRMDGGYTVSTLGVRTIDLVPDSFRLALDYMPAMRVHWKKLRFRVGGRFAEEWRMKRRWSLSTKRHRSRQGAHARSRRRPRSCSTGARDSIAESFPAFRDVKIAETWGGMMDVMPDAIPVISAVDAVPGFFIATGFSGHGFGIGPGAGRLVADMVAGGPTIVGSHAVPPVALYRRLEPPPAPARELNSPRHHPNSPRSRAIVSMLCSASPAKRSTRWLAPSST